MKSKADLSAILSVISLWQLLARHAVRRQKCRKGVPLSASIAALWSKIKNSKHFYTPGMETKFRPRYFRYYAGDSISRSRRKRKYSFLHFHLYQPDISGYNQQRRLKHWLCLLAYATMLLSRPILSETPIKGAARHSTSLPFRPYSEFVCTTASKWGITPQISLLLPAIHRCTGKRTMIK